MRQCSRWNDCNAPLCPLHGGSSHIRGEPVCFYLREAVKPGGPDLLRAEPDLSSEMAEQIIQQASYFSAPDSPMHDALRTASRVGSKLKAGRALQAVTAKRCPNSNK